MTRRSDARRVHPGAGFLMGPEARAWVEAAESGSAEPEVAEVAVDAIRRDYGRTARLLLGWAMVGPLVVSVFLALLLAPVPSNSLLSIGSEGDVAVMFAGAVLVAGASGAVVVLLQRSGRRLSRGAATWLIVSAPVSSSSPGSGSSPGRARFSKADRELEWQADVFGRIIYLVFSAVAIVLSVGLVVVLADSEGGALRLPLAVAAAIQIVIWIGVCSGVRRLFRAAG